MVKIDLHTHSNHSDGKLSPKELIDLAINKGMPVIAITDHDKASANKEAEEYSKDKPIEYISGIEITITPPEGVRELHIVGLFIDSENDEILEIPKRHKVYAEKVIKKIIEKLRELNYEITFEELLRENKGCQFGRPFIAEFLLKKYPDKFVDRKDVFNKLLGKKGKAFVKAKGTEMGKAIEIIHNAGGIAIIAHPWYLGENMEKIIDKFVQLGGDGIEREYIPKPSIPEETGEILDKLIKKHNLIISGGTDFHEIREESNEIGDVGLTNEEFKSLKKYWNSFGGF